MLTVREAQAHKVRCLAGWLHECCRGRCFWLISGIQLRRFSRKRACHGRSKKEDLAVAPRYATLAPRAQTRCLCGMP
jgi:hypothetical protein